MWLEVSEQEREWLRGKISRNKIMQTFVGKDKEELCF